MLHGTDRWSGLFSGRKYRMASVGDLNVVGSIGWPLLVVSMISNCRYRVVPVTAGWYKWEKKVFP